MFSCCMFGPTATCSVLCLECGIWQHFKKRIVCSWQMGRLYTQILSLSYTHTHTFIELFLLVCIFEISELQARSMWGESRLRGCAAKLLIKPLKYFLSCTFTPKHVIWDWLISLGSWKTITRLNITPTFKCPYWFKMTNKVSWFSKQLWRDS